MQDKPGISCHIKKSRNYQKLIELRQNDLLANLKTDHIGKVWDNLSISKNNYNEMKL